MQGDVIVSIDEIEPRRVLTTEHNAYIYVLVPAGAKERPIGMGG